MVKRKLQDKDFQVTLNIGGTHFQTTRDTLTSVKGSFFCTFIKSKKAKIYFIDRDPEFFHIILCYLRTKVFDIRTKYDRVQIAKILNEVKFYEIEPMLKPLEHIFNGVYRNLYNVDDILQLGLFLSNRAVTVPFQGSDTLHGISFYHCALNHNKLIKSIDCEYYWMTCPGVVRNIQILIKHEQVENINVYDQSSTDEDDDSETKEVKAFYKDDKAGETHLEKIFSIWEAINELKGKRRMTIGFYFYKDQFDMEGMKRIFDFRLKNMNSRVRHNKGPQEKYAGFQLKNFDETGLKA